MLYCFIKALKQPQDHFNIQHYVSFSTNSTKSASTNKLRKSYEYQQLFWKLLLQQITKSMEQTSYHILPVITNY